MDKRIGWKMMVFTSMILITVVVFWGVVVNHPNLMTGTRNPNQSPSSEPTEHELTITTNWSEPVAPRFSQKIISYMATPDLYWEVRVRYADDTEEIIKRLPINYSESNNFKCLKPIRSFSWRITPIELEPLNKGTSQIRNENLQGKIIWHIEPVSKSI